MKKLLILLFLASTIFAQTPSKSLTTNLRLKQYNAGVRNIADSINWNWDRIDQYWKINRDSISVHRNAINTNNDSISVHRNELNSKIEEGQSLTFTNKVEFDSVLIFPPTSEVLSPFSAGIDDDGIVYMQSDALTIDTTASRSWVRNNIVDYRVLYNNSQTPSGDGDLTMVNDSIAGQYADIFFLATFYKRQGDQSLILTYTSQCDISGGAEPAVLETYLYVDTTYTADETAIAQEYSYAVLKTKHEPTTTINGNDNFTYATEEKLELDISSLSSGIYTAVVAIDNSGIIGTGYFRYKVYHMTLEVKSNPNR